MNRNIDVIFLVKHFLWLIWVEGKEGRMRRFWDTLIAFCSQ